MPPRRKGLGKGLDSMFPSYADNPREKQPSEIREKQKKENKVAVSKEKPVKKKPSVSFEDAEEEIIAVSETAAEAAENPVQADEEEKEGDILVLKISDVEPNRSQPRRTFNEDTLQELSESIRQYGVIQPLIVQKREDYYEIIAGERRWRAAKMAGLKEVPVIIRDYTNQEIMEISLIENIQREDLNPIEEAQAYERLLHEFHLKQDELAEKVSKSRTTITNSLRLLKLDERVRQMLIDEMLTTGHARALLSLTDGDLQYETAQKIFDEQLSVREVEKLVKRLLAPPPEKKEEEDENSLALELICHEMEDKMKDVLGTKVVVNRKTRDKGRIEIEYYSTEELERLYELLRSLRQN